MLMVITLLTNVARRMVRQASRALRWDAASAWANRRGQIRRLPAMSPPLGSYRRKIVDALWWRAVLSGGGDHPDVVDVDQVVSRALPRFPWSVLVPRTPQGNGGGAT